MEALDLALDADLDFPLDAILVTRDVCRRFLESHSTNSNKNLFHNHRLALTLAFAPKSLCLTPVPSDHNYSIFLPAPSSPTPSHPVKPTVHPKVQKSRSQLFQITAQTLFDQTSPIRLICSKLLLSSIAIPTPPRTPDAADRFNHSLPIPLILPPPTPKSSRFHRFRRDIVQFRSVRPVTSWIFLEQ